MTEKLTQQQIHNLKYLPIRCGLCNRVVKGKTWEEHMNSKEHQFRLNLLKDELDKKKKLNHNNELLWGDREIEAVRNGANSPETVDFT